MGKQSLAAIVVTYNRANLLIRCVKAIFEQILLPNAIYIVDNKSKDSTQEFLIKEGWLDLSRAPEDSVDGKIYTKLIYNKKKSVKINYLIKNENNGGAGGFYAGMKAAYEAGYDWFWMMDDDGLPEKDALYHLYYISLKHHLLMANSLVISEEDHSRLLFGLDLGLDVNLYKELEVVQNQIHPFNGTFISRDVIKNIGFVKKEMFIWGDEIEYTLRTMNAGYKVATICASIHYHPSIAKKTVNMIPFINKYRIPDIPVNRRKIYFRNRGYIISNYSNKKNKIKFVLKYTAFFLSRFNLLGYIKFWSSFKEGKRGIFGK